MMAYEEAGTLNEICFRYMWLYCSQ